MIYKNDAIIEKADCIIGTIEDLKEYFRYKIASQCLTGHECDYEDFRYNVNNYIGLLDNLYNRTSVYPTDDKMKVRIVEHPMGGYIVEEIGDEESEN